MMIRELCNQDVVCVTRADSVADAARLMREHHVGSIVVVDQRDSGRIPVGMLTDRDIAVGVVALGLDPEKTPAEAAMGARLVSAPETESVARAVALMKANGIRRLPVVNAAGLLSGILAADDLLEQYAGEIGALAGIIGRANRRERSRRTASL